MYLPQDFSCIPIPVPFQFYFHSFQWILVDSCRNRWGTVKYWTMDPCWEPTLEELAHVRKLEVSKMIVENEMESDSRMIVMKRRMKRRMVGNQSYLKQLKC